MQTVRKFLRKVANRQADRQTNGGNNYFLLNSYSTPPATRHIRRLLTTEHAAVTLAYSLIVFRVDQYNGVLHGACIAGSIQKLQRVQNTAVRICNRAEGHINRDNTWGITLKGRATLLLFHGYTRSRSRSRSDSDQSSDSSSRVPRPASAAAEQVTYASPLIGYQNPSQPTSAGRCDVALRKLCS